MFKRRKTLIGIIKCLEQEKIDLKVKVEELEKSERDRSVQILVDTIKDKFFYKKEYNSDNSGVMELSFRIYKHKVKVILH